MNVRFIHNGVHILMEWPYKTIPCLNESIHVGSFIDSYDIPAFCDEMLINAHKIVSVVWGYGHKTGLTKCYCSNDCTNYIITFMLD